MIQSNHQPGAVLSAQFRRKLAPYLALLYLFLFLDRQNINFAGLQMKAELDLSGTAFGLAVGLFSIGYCMFEIPSTLMLRRVGARVWLARIMVTWGLLSAATAFITTSTALYTVRFLLGAAEAGFVPGVIYYLTNWLPAAERGRVIGVFMLAVPASTIIGAPVSGMLLELHAFGLRGWQWLFLLEGLPAALLGVSILRFLPERPSDVSWLGPQERLWLANELERERIDRSSNGPTSIRAALTSPIVMMLGVIYLGNGIGLFGISTWLPLLVRNLGLSFTKTGFVISGIYVMMAVVMILWTRHASEKREYVWHLAVAGMLGVACMVAAALTRVPTLTVGLLGLALVFLSPLTPTFWNLPPQVLSGAGSAAGIALISSIGALGAFIGPALLGFAADHAEGYAAGLLFLTAGPIVAGGLTLSLVGRRGFY